MGHPCQRWFNIERRVVRTVHKTGIRRFVTLPARPRTPFPTALAQHGSDRDHPQQLFAAFGTRKAARREDFSLGEERDRAARGARRDLLLRRLAPSADGVARPAHIVSYLAKRAGPRFRSPAREEFDLPSAQGGYALRGKQCLTCQIPRLRMSDCP